ncbi:MAG: 30S ribosomal protein S21 [Candidatus Eremiobacteraeota bacterium]|nr:30S ribosomal protein S21 [Candidatus Eremiobacteraeota bacterium]
MMETRVGENESLEDALKRFRRSCQRNGVMQEMKRREFYEKPSERKKRKIEARARKKRRR